MKPMTKSDFILHVGVAKKANVEVSISRNQHRVYLVRGDDIKMIARGWDIDTASRHEAKFNLWLKSL